MSAGFAPRAEPPPSELSGIARAAAIVGLGNVVSRLLGMAREIVKADLFGATGQVSAFEVAAIVPTMLYDLIVGGLVSSALVPVFSDYAAPERRDELWRLVSTLVGLVVGVLTILVLLVEVFAPQVTWLVSGGLKPESLALATALLRLTAPAVIFLNLSGILAGLLYALKRFSLPAFTAAIFNGAIVVVALLLAGRIGIRSLAVGLLAGAAFQVLLQLPGLRRTRLSFAFNWRHPALRRIGLLYVPIVLGLVVDIISRTLSYNLASRTGDASISLMRYATTLTQFPLGLVATAVSVAILPTLSRQAADLDARRGRDDFIGTLAHGLRLVLILIIPATVGLFVLAQPIVRLIFEHGDFLSTDTATTVVVLRLYLLGVIWAAIDQPLIFAFYARKDTWSPAIVGVVGVGFYLVTALGPTLVRPMQLSDLVLANVVQLTSHALIMLYLLKRGMGGLGGHAVGMTAIKSGLASAGLAAGAMGGLWGMAAIGAPNGLVGEIALVAAPGGVGLIAYVALIALLDVPEARMLFAAVKTRLWLPRTKEASETGE
ncbi:MAG: murein biosynthesis integral membrane protein MurJ [Chloroflexi bacterium]|nr:murein biosynthesis integral membrane protein MurJ [Chloroflexota bacterium]